MIQKIRFKPIELEAIQFNSYDDLDEIKEFCDPEYVDKDVDDSEEQHILIFGDLGHEVYPGNWIVLESGEFNIYSNDKFNEVFEIIN